MYKELVICLNKSCYGNTFTLGFTFFFNIFLFFYLSNEKKNEVIFIMFKLEKIIILNNLP